MTEQLTIPPSLPNPAWAGGLFEGEGCITTDRSKHGRVRMVLSLETTDRDVAETFARIVGKGKLREQRRTDRGHRKPMHRWVVVGATAEAVLEQLWPWLHERRREAAAQVQARVAEYEREVTQPRQCANCRETFAPVFGTRARAQKFCSRRCNGQASDHRRAPRRRRERALRRQEVEQ